MTRAEKIIAAVRPYATAANFEIDVMQAVLRTVPDASPLEVADAFDAIAEQAEREAAALRAGRAS
jgi:hypothetical protein